MKEGSRSLFRILAPFVLALLSTGCTNLPAVRTYAGETRKLAAAFQPMLEGSTRACTENFVRKKLVSATSFDAEATAEAAKGICGPIEEDNEAIAALNILLEEYADALAALADDKVVTYKKELGDLRTSLGKVKKPGTDTKLLDPDRLTAIASLADVLGRLATQSIQSSTIASLLGHEEAVAGVTFALADYARLNYRAYLSDARRDIAILRKDVASRADTEPLASRLLEAQLFLEARQVGERDKAVDELLKAIDRQQKAHTRLRATLHEKSDKEVLLDLLSFADAVSELEGQLTKAF